MKIVLIRHPETLANARKLVYGHADWEYSEKGYEAVDRISDYIHRTYQAELECPTTQIIASPLTRTKYLAEQIAKGTNLQVSIVDDIIEMNVGIFENMTVPEASKNYEAEWKEFMEDSIHYRVPEGESWSDVYNRSSQYIESIKDMDGTVIIVSHAMVIRSILSHVMGIDLDKTWHFKIDPGHCIEIEYNHNFGMIHEIKSFF